MAQPTTLIQRSIGGLTFDAVVSESHTVTTEITDNPVESGVSITDHAYMKPYKVVIEAGVTNTPLHEPTDNYGTGDARVANAYAALLQLQATREPFDVQTGLLLYNNMLIQELTVIQDKDTSNVLAFSATLREIVIVYTETVKYPPRKAGATKNQAGKKKESGQKQGTDQTSPSASTKKGSLASKTLDVLSKGLGK
jgi:hypothetical protein